MGIRNGRLGRDQSKALNDLTSTIGNPPIFQRFLLSKSNLIRKTYNSNVRAERIDKVELEN